MKVLTFVLAFSMCLAGCSRPVAPQATVTPPSSSAAAAEAQRPHFESVLVLTHHLGGGPGTARHSGTRYDDAGKPFRAVENYSTTVTVGTAKLTLEVRFLNHRAGKDWYSVTYTHAEGNNSTTQNREVGYDGQRTALVEDERCTLVLQPPGPEDEPAKK